MTTYTITGKVKQYDGSGLGGVEVRLLNEDGTPANITGASDNTNTSDTNGVYTFEVEKAGAYQVVFPTACTPGPSALWTLVKEDNSVCKAEVNDGNKERKDLDALYFAQTVTGKVVDRSGGGMNIVVHVELDSDLKLDAQNRTIEAKTNDGGDYTLMLGVGTHILHFWPKCPKGDYILSLLTPEALLHTVTILPDAPATIVLNPAVYGLPVPAAIAGIGGFEGLLAHVGRLANAIAGPDAGPIATKEAEVGIRIREALERWRDLDAKLKVMLDSKVRHPDVAALHKVVDRLHHVIQMEQLWLESLTVTEETAAELASFVELRTARQMGIVRGTLQSLSGTLLDQSESQRQLSRDDYNNLLNNIAGIQSGLPAWAASAYIDQIADAELGLLLDSAPRPREDGHKEYMDLAGALREVGLSDDQMKRILIGLRSKQFTRPEIERMIKEARADSAKTGDLIDKGKDIAVYPEPEKAANGIYALERDDKLGRTLDERLDEILRGYNGSRGLRR